MSKNKIICYTDGSYNPRYKVGGWAALIVTDTEPKILQGIKENENQHRMEITAAIAAVEFVVDIGGAEPGIIIFTDSQYVVGIPLRIKELRSGNFITAQGKPLHNSDLIIKLAQLAEQYDLEFIKVPAHQKAGEANNYTRTVDKLSRKIVREFIKRSLSTQPPDAEEPA